MELEKLDGNIIGVISLDFKLENFNGKKVKEIIVKKVNESLKMVKLNSDVLDKNFEELSSREMNKVILASKLQNKVILLVNFSKGMLKKDLEYFKALFKKIRSYGRKIILIDCNAELFIGLVDHYYVITNQQIKYETKDAFDRVLENYIEMPPIVKFINHCEFEGIRLDHYYELDELLKAIYRIKS